MECACAGPAASQSAREAARRLPGNAGWRRQLRREDATTTPGGPRGSAALQLPAFSAARQHYSSRRAPETGRHYSSQQAPGPTLQLLGQGQLPVLS